MSRVLLHPPAQLQRRVARRGVALAVGLAAFCSRPAVQLSGQAAAPPAQDVMRLAQGAAIERTLSIGESHTKAKD